MKIAIYGQSKDEISVKIFSELLTIAKNKNHQIIVEENFNSIINQNHKNMSAIFNTGMSLINTMPIGHV